MKRSKTGYQIHVTDREAWALAVHLITATRPENHAEQATLFHACEEFGLNEIIAMLTTSDAPVNMNMFDAKQYEIVNVGRETLGFVLKKTDVAMAPVHALVLRPLIERMQQAQAGTYRLPKGSEPPADDQAEAAQA